MTKAASPTMTEMPYSGRFIFAVAWASVFEVMTGIPRSKIGTPPILTET